MNRPCEEEARRRSNPKVQTRTSLRGRMTKQPQSTKTIFKLGVAALSLRGGTTKQPQSTKTIFKLGVAALHFVPLAMTIIREGSARNDDNRRGLLCCH